MAGDDVRMAHKLQGGYRARNGLPGQAGSRHGGADPVDALLEKKLLNDLNRNPPPKPSHPRSRIVSGKKLASESGGAEADQDLMSSMMRRLATAERELKLKSQQLLRVKGERDGLLDKVDELEQQLKERDEQIADLESQRPAHGMGDPANASDIIAAMRKENLLLRQQNDRAWNEVGHLKEFLSDYGLVWVGEDEAERPYEGPSSENSSADGAEKEKPAWFQYGAGMRSEASEEDEWRPAASRAPPQEQPSLSTSSLPVEIAVLEKAIKELNDVAGDGCFNVVKGTRGEAQLRPPEPVYLVVYSDGLQLHTLKFCTWEEKVCKSMLNDILEGYFPSALKHEFPGGVPLRLVDKSKEPFPVGFKAFQGEGQVLSGAPSKPNPTGGYTLGGRGPQAAHPPPGLIRGMGDVLGGAKPAHQQQANFLDKLPQAVIRNGKIIPVREDVANMLQPPKNDLEMAMVNTPVDDLLNTVQRNHAGPRMPSGPRGKNGSPRTSSTARSSAERTRTDHGQQIATLQVKREDGSKVYIIKLRFDSTVQDLREALDSHRVQEPGSSNVQYQIRTAFPPRTYEDGNETLETAGLVPNAALFLRAL